MAKRVFVSDIHMSKGGSGWDWMSAVQAERLLDFLEYVNRDDSFHELILLGDILDIWVYPIELQPPHFSDIMAANVNAAAIITKLKEISRTKKVTYVVGNHDMTIGKDSIPDFGNGAFQNIFFRQSYETMDGVFAAHGHQYSMYNSEDPRNELPMGYYVSRLQATSDEGKSSSGKWQKTLDNAYTPDTLKYMDNPYVNWPLNHFATELHIDDDTNIVKKDGSNITLRNVRDMYRDLPERWKEANGTLAPLDSGIMELTQAGLDSVAEFKAKGEEKKLVIFGHTHTPRISQIFREGLGIEGSNRELIPVAIYANSGSWCEETAKYTYVVDQYDEAAKRHTVTLMHWWPENGEERPPLTI